jgi:hypothetical protein
MRNQSNVGVMDKNTYYPISASAIETDFALFDFTVVLAIAKIKPLNIHNHFSF